jgi:hypothetical protein
LQYVYTVFSHRELAPQPFYHVGKGEEVGTNCSAHFGRCILMHLPLALCVFLYLATHAGTGRSLYSVYLYAYEPKSAATA